MHQCCYQSQPHFSGTSCIVFFLLNLALCYWITLKVQLDASKTQSTYHEKDRETLRLVLEMLSHPQMVIAIVTILQCCCDTDICCEKILHLQLHGNPNNPDYIWKLTGITTNKTKFSAAAPVGENCVHVKQFLGGGGVVAPVLYPGRMAAVVGGHDVFSPFFTFWGKAWNIW